MDLSFFKNLTLLDLSGNFLTSIKLCFRNGSEHEVYGFKANESAYINLRATARDGYEHFVLRAVPMDSYKFDCWYEFGSGKNYTRSYDAEYAFGSYAAELTHIYKYGKFGCEGIAPV